MYKYRYVIIRIVIMIFLFFIGLTIGLSNRKTKMVWVEIPCDCDQVYNFSEEQPETLSVEIAEEKYKFLDVVATAYCPCIECSEGYGNNTATGTIAREGRTIAVDPKVIPYGTEVVINGNTYIAEDCGGLIKGNKIDIYFDTHEETVDFGIKNLKVEIRENIK